MYIWHQAWTCHILVEQYYCPSHYGWRDKFSAAHSARKRWGTKKNQQAQVFWVFLLVMTNVQPNEISLYYSLELKSKAHHFNANIFCRKHFACDSPRSDSRKSTFSFGLDNLPPVYLSPVLSSSLSPQTLYSATSDSQHSFPHISWPHSLLHNQFSDLYNEDDRAKPHRDTQSTHKKVPHIADTKIYVNYYTCPSNLVF